MQNMGHSVPTVTECDKNERGEYMLGSQCYTFSWAPERTGTLTILCRTDENGKMVDTDVILQDNDIKKNKEVVKDTPFHHTKAADAKKGFEFRIKADKEVLTTWTFPQELIKNALDEREKEAKVETDTKPAEDC